MSFRPALDGKVLHGQFTGNTGTTLTIPITGEIGRFDPNTSTIQVDILSAEATQFGTHRITTFTTSSIVITWEIALVAADRVHVEITG